MIIIIKIFAAIFTLAQRNDSFYVLLLNHIPKVSSCVIFRSLSGNDLRLTIGRVDMACIDVGYSFYFDNCLFKRRHVRVNVEFAKAFYHWFTFVAMAPTKKSAQSLEFLFDLSRRFPLDIIKRFSQLILLHLQVSLV